MDNNDPPPLAATALPPRSEIAGFWRRVLAACIDSFILGASGWLLGLFFAEQFMHMGSWGRFLGFAIALLYFVPLNSRLGAGQTLGKRALRTRVIAASGDPLTISRSFIRSFVLLLPYFLNGVPIPLRMLQTPLGVAVGVAIFGLGLSILYLILFNRRTRQWLHDLVVESYVVQTGTEQGDKPLMWKGHYVGVALIFVLAMAISFIGPRLAMTPWFASLLTAYEAVCREPEVASAQVMAGSTYFWDNKQGQQTVSDVTIGIRLNRRIADKEAEANKFARILLENYPEASTKDSIGISLAEGYDIGIASWSIGYRYNYSPAQWREKIGPAPPASE